jgi:hypothetical protein
VRNILNDPSIVQGNQSLGTLGDLGRMRHQNDRPTIAMQILEEGHDFVAGASVQCPGWLVGQDKCGIVHHRAGNDDALLLSSGKLIWEVMEATGQANPVEDVFGSAAALPAKYACIDEWKLDIFDRAHPRQKRRKLEYEADIVAPD